MVRCVGSSSARAFVISPQLLGAVTLAFTQRGTRQVQYLADWTDATIAYIVRDPVDLLLSRWERERMVVANDTRRAAKLLRLRWRVNRAIDIRWRSFLDGRRSRGEGRSLVVPLRVLASDPEAFVVSVLGHDGARPYQPLRNRTTASRPRQLGLGLRGSGEEQHLQLRDWQVQSSQSGVSPDVVRVPGAEELQTVLGVLLDANASSDLDPLQLHRICHIRSAEPTLQNASELRAALGALLDAEMSYRLPRPTR